MLAQRYTIAIVILKAAAFILSEVYIIFHRSKARRSDEPVHPNLPCSRSDAGYVAVTQTVTDWRSVSCRHVSSYRPQLCVALNQASRGINHGQVI